MKKILLIFAICLCALQPKAQNYVDFLGLQLNGNTKATFAEKLIEKGYTYQNEKDGYVLYAGQFVGVDAYVMLVPSETSDGITAVSVSVEELNPVKMGQLFAELVQKYMQKYADYKYTTQTQPNGSTQIMFRKNMPGGLMDFVVIESGVTGSKCKLTINYATGIKSDTATSDGGGISIDDI